jgi:hypothetical protein
MIDSPCAPVVDWSGLIGRLSTDIGLDLDALARETKALRRRRGVPDAAALLRLALARGPGGLSLRQTAAWARAAGVAELTDPSLNDRLHGACDFLAAIIKGLLLAKAAGPACSGGQFAAPRFPAGAVRISDSTCVSKPGSEGTDWRVHGVYDLASGGFSHLEVTDAHGGEAIDRGAAIAGEIRLGDRGYSSPKALGRFVANGKDADYLVRLRWSSFRLSTPRGEPFNLIGHLKAMPADRLRDDFEAVIENTGERGAPGLTTRIVVLRKPDDVACAERARLRREASRRGKQLDPDSLVAAGFVMLATSLLAEKWSARALFALYRLRWQIELAFKRLKSLLRIDRLPAITGKGARSWIYAHLIVALLADASSQDFLDSSP